MRRRWSRFTAAPAEPHVPDGLDGADGANAKGWCGTGLASRAAGVELSPSRPGPTQKRPSLLSDPLVALALTAAIAHLGGFVRGVTGFGAALAITPLLTLYTPPQVVVPSIVLATAFTNLPFMYRSFRAVDLKAVIFLACGAVAGLPVGLALLTLLDPEPLKRVIGLCVIASVIALQLSRRFAIRPGRWRAASFGLVSGIVNGVSGLGGPPGVLYAVVTGMRPEVARATLMFY